MMDTLDRKLSSIEHQATQSHTIYWRWGVLAGVQLQEIPLSSSYGRLLIQEW